MLNTLFKFGFDKTGTMKNIKINSQEAQRLLDKYFKQELASVYTEINKFREGVKSLEVYNSQQSAQIGNSTPQLTMFHQMLYFLSLKEEVAIQAQDHHVRQQTDQNNSNSQSPARAFFTSLLSEEEVQGIIFDDKYLKYVKSKEIITNPNLNLSAAPSSGVASANV